MPAYFVVELEITNQTAMERQTCEQARSVPTATQPVRRPFHHRRRRGGGGTLGNYSNASRGAHSP
jgi:hypothetical protein